MQSGKIVSAYALDRHGIAAAVSKMAFGNGLGFKIEHNLDPRDFFAPGFGDLVIQPKHRTDDGTKAQRGEVSCVRSHS